MCGCLRTVTCFVKKMSTLCSEFQKIEEIMSLGLGEGEKTQHDKHTFSVLKLFVSV